MSKHLGRRLNSWKQIARYLGRHVRTVRRWEQKGVGMPVHRVPGGRSVFAYTDDLDEWLEKGTPSEPEEEDRPSRITGAPMHALVGLALVAFATVAWGLVPSGSSSTPEISTIETANGHILGYDLSGGLAWTFVHPEGRSFQPESQIKRVTEMPAPGGKLFLLSSTTLAEGEAMPRRTELMAFESSGELSWRATRTESYRFGAATFTEPWTAGVLNTHAAAQGIRIAWSTHHYTWWPSTLFLLDGEGNSEGPFVNSGWILSTALLAKPAGDKLLVGGVSNSRSGAMVAVLDVADIRGRSPEEPGSEFECLDCPQGGPLRYLVFPPTDVNGASGLPYNQTTSIDLRADQILVTVKEGPDASDVAWMYHFSLDFEFLAATPGDSYWPAHRLLELDGKLDHGIDSCPWNSPPTVHSWTADEGWTELRVADGS